MKQVKKIMYLLTVVVVMLFWVVVGTYIVQLGMMAVSEKMGIAIDEDLLYHVSGNSGIVLAVIWCVVYVKKRRYVEKLGEVDAFGLKKAVVYTVLTVCICQILTNAGTTLLFSNVLPLVTEQTQVGITYVDVLFAVIMAPIFEELLFRMGIYSLLRNKFGRGSSIIICAAIFAVIHGYQIQGFLSCLAAGLVLTLLYDKTRNIVYCMVAHAFCNLFSSVMNVMENAGVTLLGVPLQYESNGYVMFHPVIILSATAYCGVFWWMTAGRSKYRTALLKEIREG